MKGKEILKIEKEVFSLLQKFNINFSDGKFMRVESKISFLVRRIEIDYNGESLSLEGQFPDLNFEIYRGKDLIGEIEKTFFALTDTYKLTVHYESYTSALIALTLCLNNMKDADRNN
ncbi:LURP-one-related family protein [Peptoniphilus lacydonensis]|uniref:LURP-one-related/scramblase family protein n=1 Tax=Peptoniphilus lacydonensis TaxID=1673725 RepID=UPI00291340AD|nr:LURP-one-related family protein [Peptoniphilus lacydonensis]MDU5436584.1 LURP-one-related family protein [Peptoniphilus lacydonensis]